MRITKKKAAFVAVSTAAAVGAATAGYAYWSSTGSGTGTATTTAGVTEQLGFATSTIADMYPGDSAQPFKVTVTNNATSQSVYVATVSAYLTVAGGAGTCGPADYKLDGTPAGSYNPETPKSLGWTAQELAHGASASTNNADTIQFNDTNVSQDGCKGATVTIHYAAQ